MKKVVYGMDSFFLKKLQNFMNTWLLACTNMLTSVGSWDGMMEEKGKGVNKLQQKESKCLHNRSRVYFMTQFM